MKVKPFANEKTLNFTKPENRRRRITAAARKRYDARFAGGTVFQLSNVSAATSTARRARSAFPFWNTPSTSVGRDGLSVENLSGASIFSPPMTSGYSRPASDRIRSIAAACRRRFELNATMILEVGKTWPEADADRAEAIDFLEFYAREMLRYGVDHPVVRNPGETGKLVYIPLGVGVVIPPWNFPLAILYEHGVPVDKLKGYIVVRSEVTGPRERIERWKSNLNTALARGLRVQTQLAGITGQQFLALDYLDPKTPPPLDYGWKPDHPVVPSAPSLTGEIIAGAQKFMASLNKAEVAELGQNLNKVLVNMNAKLDQLDVAQLSAEGVGLLKDARATVQRIDQVVAKAPVDQAVTNVSSAAGRLDKLLANPGLNQTVDNTAAFTARLRAAAAEGGEIDRIVKDLDEAVQRPMQCSLTTRKSEVGATPLTAASARVALVRITVEQSAESRFAAVTLGCETVNKTLRSGMFIQ